ncbi:MAG: hypothetical protein U5O39_02215 [Gammaproteobacteria bacterium]|nr:hypothetical protein [Gammaproteobacteria bacterium]
MEENDAAEATITKTRWLLRDPPASPPCQPPHQGSHVAKSFSRSSGSNERPGRRASGLRGVIGSVFRLAIVTLRAENDPTLRYKARSSHPRRMAAPPSPTSGNSANCSAQSTIMNSLANTQGLRSSFWR